MTKIFNIENVKGERPINCGCSSWIEHWENNTGQKSNKCAATDCEDKAEHGAHVINCGKEGAKEFIAPLCPACNTGRDECFKIIPPVVAATKLTTC